MDRIGLECVIGDRPKKGSQAELTGWLGWLESHEFSPQTRFQNDAGTWGLDGPFLDDGPGPGVVG